MKPRERATCEKALGYRFSDEKLLAAAFTHSSYVNEHGGESNERLEFLGDCVLNFIVGVRLYNADKSAAEGSLSSRRASLVSRAPLARIVDSLGVMDMLEVGAGVNKSDFSVKARSDLYEAVIGAIYLDGGLKECERFLDRTFFGTVEPERDYKTELQEYCVKRGIEAVYETEPSGGGFTCTVDVAGAFYTGSAKTKHGAQIAAAKSAIEALP
ncbi:MAG: ribonuclease III [Clostridiales bacterium]|nr:ribonuclease III [Clostridiales bacterium]